MATLSVAFKAEGAVWGVRFAVAYFLLSNMIAVSVLAPVFLYNVLRSQHGPSSSATTAAPKEFPLWTTLIANSFSAIWMIGFHILATDKSVSLKTQGDWASLMLPLALPYLLSSYSVGTCPHSSLTCASAFS